MRKPRWDQVASADGMLTEAEVKQRLASILSVEERFDAVDWPEVARLSAALLQQLPPELPPIIEAYLTEFDKRSADIAFAYAQRSELVRYLRS